MLLSVSIATLFTGTDPKRTEAQIFMDWCLATLFNVRKAVTRDTHTESFLFISPSKKNLIASELALDL